MKRDIGAIIARMTLEEKAGMCSGLDFWHLKGVERLGIPSVMVTDGPHGLRKQAGAADHLGINDSIEAVCFPAACATAASFDRDLLRTMGGALGAECRAEGVSVLLGPAVNIKRSPLCGRNFEYFSEDPYLAGEMAAAHIQGVQGHNVGTSIKHFAANNQEEGRMRVSAEMEERTLREIYLTAFERAVKQARPWTVMCSYNRVNGVYAAEDPYLLTEILRDEWGFDGYVVSDWGAVNDRVAGLAAGLDLEMPASGGVNDGQIVAAVREGRLAEAVLDRAVERILEKIFAFADDPATAVFDREADHRLAVAIEEDSAVLLRNDGVLPLAKGQSVAFIGGFAEAPRFQGGGSSHINAHKTVSALSAAKGVGGVVCERGFPADRDERDDDAHARAVEAARRAGVAVVFAGLPDSFESEGYDRAHMRLPDCQNELIDDILKVQKNLVVVLHNGSPIEMPWAGEARAILEMYLGGQGVGEAAVRLLYGDANPSGKLAETFPLRLEDNPSYLNFPGDGTRVRYAEGVYVGYRYYDKKAMDVLFPFGHGLSYTTFAYANLRLDKAAIRDDEALTATVDITNTGPVAGKEAVQLYVGDRTGSHERPIRELKGFAKVALLPGETKTVSFPLDKRSFAYYHEGLGDWYCPEGGYAVEVGASSRDIRLSETVRVTSAARLPLEIDQNVTVGMLLGDERTAPFVQQLMAQSRAMTGGGEGEDSEVAKAAISPEMQRSMMMNMPLRALRNFGSVSQEQLDGMVERLRALVD